MRDSHCKTTSPHLYPLKALIMNNTAKLKHNAHCVRRVQGLLFVFFVCGPTFSYITVHHLFAAGWTDIFLPPREVGATCILEILRFKRACPYISMHIVISISSLHPFPPREDECSDLCLSGHPPRHCSFSESHCCARPGSCYQKFF